ncbi:hypothetical protein AYI68_g4938, partial [Smittium mucronatum]
MEMKRRYNKRHRA